MIGRRRRQTLVGQLDELNTALAQVWQARFSRGPEAGRAQIAKAELPDKVSKVVVALSIGGEAAVRAASDREELMVQEFGLRGLVTRFGFLAGMARTPLTPDIQAFPGLSEVHYELATGLDAVIKNPEARTKFKRYELQPQAVNLRSTSTIGDLVIAENPGSAVRQLAGADDSDVAQILKLWSLIGVRQRNPARYVPLVQEVAAWVNWKQQGNWAGGNAGKVEKAELELARAKVRLFEEGQPLADTAYLGQNDWQKEAAVHAAIAASPALKGNFRFLSADERALVNALRPQLGDRSPDR